MIKACIFDLDGVVVDTAKYHYIAWKKLADELGFDFTPQHNERLKGVSRMRSLDILLEIGGLSMTPEKKEKLAGRKNRHYVSMIEKMTPEEVLPGVKDFLNQLRKKNIKTALGSASKNAPIILRQIGMAHYFDAIIDGNIISKAKPHPEVFLRGAQALGVAPHECVVFEDARAGVEDTKAGGMYCIGVGNPEILKEADFVIDGFTNMTVEHLNF